MNLRKWGSKLVLVTIEDNRNNLTFYEKFIGYFWSNAPSFHIRGGPHDGTHPYVRRGEEALLSIYHFMRLNSKVHGGMLGCELNLINGPIVKYNAEFTLSAKSNITSTKIFTIFLKYLNLTSFY